MAAKQGTLLLVAGGATLLLLASGKKKKKKKSGASSQPSPVDSESKKEQPAQNMDEEEVLDEDVFEPAPSPEPAPTPPAPPAPEPSKPEPDEPMITKYIHPAGKAELGKMYQIKPGDTPLEVCREALFGSRAPVTDPAMRKAAVDLLVRIDCSPYNQAIYGVPIEELKQGHANIDSYWTQKGVSFNPIYTDNLSRMMDGLSPSAAKGNNFAFIWIPMINLDRLDLDGVVTTEGMYHPDTPNGMGGSMIDPPAEIIDLGLEDAQAGTVGCDLPEGDFRKTIIANPG